MAFDYDNRRGVDPDDAYRDRKRVAKRAQGDAQRTKLIAALRLQAAEARARGALNTSIPEITDQMSMADIANTARRLNLTIGEDGESFTPSGEKKAEPQKDVKLGAKSNEAAATASKNPLDSMPPPQKGEVRIGKPGDPKKLEKGNGISGDPSKIQRDEKGNVVTPKSAAPAAGAPAAGATQAGAAAPAATVNPLEELASPMQQAMVASGTLAPGQPLMRTGGGFQTPALNPDGTQMLNPDGTPRFVAVTPSATQALDAQTGGQYSGWSPQQRAAYLRGLNPNPAVGDVIDNGQTRVGAMPASNVVGGVEVNPAADPQFMAQARANSAAATAQNAALDRAMGVPEAPGMYDANGRLTTNTADAVRVVGTPAAAPVAGAQKPIIPTAAAGAKPGNSQNSVTTGVVNATQPVSGGISGTNPPNMAGPNGAAYQNAPRPPTPQPATSPVSSNASTPGQAQPGSTPAQVTSKQPINLAKLNKSPGVSGVVPDDEFLKNQPVF